MRKPSPTTTTRKPGADASCASSPEEKVLIAEIREFIKFGGLRVLRTDGEVSMVDIYPEKQKVLKGKIRVISLFVHRFTGKEPTGEL